MQQTLLDGLHPSVQWQGLNQDKISPKAHPGICAIAPRAPQRAERAVGDVSPSVTLTRPQGPPDAARASRVFSRLSTLSLKHFRPFHGQSNPIPHQATPNPNQQLRAAPKTHKRALFSSQPSDFYFSGSEAAQNTHKTSSFCRSAALSLRAR